MKAALPGDLPTVLSILREAADWLVARGDPLWREDELDAHDILRDINAGAYFIAYVDGDAAGTIRFERSDPLFWPDVPEGESAFVHRFAIRRRFSGGGVSTAVLAWAADRARTLGLGFLRLDCEASRPRLRRIYERFGFRHHSDRQVGPFYVARYELALSNDGWTAAPEPSSAS